METDEVILRILKMVQNPSKFAAFGKKSVHALSSASGCNGGGTSYVGGFFHYKEAGLTTSSHFGRAPKEIGSILVIHPQTYGNPDCQASKSVAKHLVAVDADGCHH
jgi:hypothetical protein